MQQQMMGKDRGNRGAAHAGRMPFLFMAFLVAGLASVMLILPAAESGASSPLTHNSQNTSTTYGTWGTAYDCVTCHEAGTTANIRKLRAVIETPIGPRPVL